MSANEVSFVLDIDPMGAIRPKTSTRGKRRVTIYTDPKMVHWKDRAIVKLQARGWAGWNHKRTEAVSCRIVCVFKRPKSRPDDLWHIVKPDGDNCEKMIWDSLVNAGVLVDDCCIAWGSIKKRYQHVGEEHLDPVGVRIFIQKLEEGT